MKLTKEALKQIIKEELENMEATEMDGQEKTALVNGIVKHRQQIFDSEYLDEGLREMFIKMVDKLYSAREAGKKDFEDWEKVLMKWGEPHYFQVDLGDTAVMDKKTASAVLKGIRGY